MNINREFLSQRNINGTGNPCKYIVIHETDNYNKGANARTHAKAQHDGNFADMSVHYYCGSDGVYRAADHTCKCWHVGRTYVSNPNNPDCTNNNSIGIEICVNSDGDYATARQNAIDLVKYLLQTTGIPADRVIRHYDAKGKYCPRKMMDNPSLWSDFKAQIQSGSSDVTPPEVDTSWSATGTATCIGNGVYYRPRPTMNCEPYGQLNKGNRFEVDGQEKNGWIHAKVVDQVCWIYKNYVQYDGQPAPTPDPTPQPSGWKATGTAICTGNGVRVRSTAEFGNNVLFWLNQGNRFEVDGQKSGEFVHINVNGTVGWMSEDYVKYDVAESASSNVSGNAIVRNGQIHANNFSGADIKEDGIRGTATKKAGIMVLQVALNHDYEAGLAVDGAYGSKTDAALGNHYVKYGETQYLVTAVEILLMLKGYNPSGVENPGQFGSGLESAVKQYQRDHGLTADGVAGRNTILSLIA